MREAKKSVKELEMQPRELIKNWVLAFNDADVDALCRLYSPDAVNHQVPEEPVVGLPAIREMFAAEFSRAEMVCIVEHIFQEGEWAILEWRDSLSPTFSPVFVARPQRWYTAWVFEQ